MFSWNISGGYGEEAEKPTPTFLDESQGKKS
jgi:hypothetical protein